MQLQHRPYWLSLILLALSAGTTLPICGCPTAPVEPQPGQGDADSDGVPNDNDQCPETPFNAAADANGCAAPQLDDDADGITNDIDLCPATPVTGIVDASGCTAPQRDSDGDGVNDNDDTCADTPPGDRVDVTGCPTNNTTSVDVTLGSTVVGKAVLKGGFRDASTIVTVLDSHGTAGTIETIVDLRKESDAPFGQGEIVVLGGIDGAIVGRVMSVHAPDRVFAGAEGQVVGVDLETVGFEDLFESIEIHVRDHVVSAPTQPRLSTNKTIVDNSNLRASGNFDVDFGFDHDFTLDIDWAWYGIEGIEEFELVFKPNFDAELRIEVEAKQAFDEARYSVVGNTWHVPFINFNVGPIPVTIRPELAIGLGVKARATVPGKVVAAGNIDAGWHVGIRCPPNEDCDWVNDFPADVSATMEYSARGLIDVQAFGSVKLSATLGIGVDLYFADVSLDVAKLQVEMETYFGLSSESKTGALLAPPEMCLSSPLIEGPRRVKYSVVAGATGHIEGEVKWVFEGQKQYDLFEVGLPEAGGCFSWRNNVVVTP